MSSDTTLLIHKFPIDASLLSRVKRWVDSTCDADDVVQTVAAKLWRDGLTPEPAYINRMLRNAAIDMRRSSNTRAANEAAFADDYTAADDHSPETILEWREALGMLTALIDEMSQVNQEIFVRCLVHGEPRAEVADELGIHVSTLEKRLKSIRRQAFDHIAQYLNPS
ncbi:MAG: sigma-70 family RNA polymerase sigma factor [Pseudomonadota bacterium]